MALAIALADDSLIVREGVAQILAGEPEMQIVASCGDLPSLLAAVEADPPDVVVTDIRMPPTSTDEGIRLARLLREEHPDIGVVVLSNYAEPAYALALLDSGSEGRGYVLKDRLHSRAQLLATIEAVSSGGSVIDPEVVDALVHGRSPLHALTPREHEVLVEMARGASNGAIAQALGLTKRAVEKHINSVFAKLDLPQSDDVSRRVRAVLLFLGETGGAAR
jgi:DNA-binding NarL/FixJ family response regulator